MKNSLLNLSGFKSDNLFHFMFCLTKNSAAVEYHIHMLPRVTLEIFCNFLLDISRFIYFIPIFLVVSILFGCSS